MTSAELRERKSIMYRIISLGCSVYTDDWDNFLISLLICQNPNCHTLWNKSRSECFYCGTENYHVYTCSECNKYYSITNAVKTCSTPNCTGVLTKKCINPNCISNTNSKLASLLSSYNGVFQTNKSGSTLNEMRCKKCGEKTSTFVSVKAQFVDAIPSECSVTNILYIKRNNYNMYNALYNQTLFENETLETIIKNIFNLPEDTLIPQEELI